MGTLHLVVNVFALFWKTPCLLKLKKTISLSHGRTLSGHTWSTVKKFSILNLSSLHPYGKPYLGHSARRWFTVLGDRSRCSAIGYAARQRFTLLGDGSCSSAVQHGGWTMSLTARRYSHLLGQAQDDVAQWVQGARGLAMGGMTPDTHGRPHGLCP